MTAARGVALMFAIAACAPRAQATPTELPIGAVAAPTPSEALPPPSARERPPPEGKRRMSEGECDILERHAMTPLADQMRAVSEREGAEILAAFRRRCADLCWQWHTDEEIHCLLEIFDVDDAHECVD